MTRLGSTFRGSFAVHLYVHCEDGTSGLLHSATAAFSTLSTDRSRQSRYVFLRLPVLSLELVRVAGRHDGLEALTCPCQSVAPNAAGGGAHGDASRLKERPIWIWWTFPACLLFLLLLFFSLPLSCSIILFNELVDRR